MQCTCERPILTLQLSRLTAECCPVVWTTADKIGRGLALQRREYRKYNTQMISKSCQMILLFYFFTFCQAQPSTPASAIQPSTQPPTHPGKVSKWQKLAICRKQSWLAWLVALKLTSDKCDKSSK